MKAIKVLMTTAAVLALVVVAAPDAQANCGQNKLFRSGGMDSQPNLRITPGYSGQGVGTAIGRWWDSSNAALSSNFGSNAGTCDSVNWWLQLGSGNKYIDGTLDDPTLGCVGYAGCPGLEMTVVVEDFGPAGDPGINDTAYWVGFRVDDTPATLRRYNFGRASNLPDGNHVRPFLEFPTVDIQDSNRVSASVEINYDLADQADRVHTAMGAANMPLAPTSVLSEYQLMVATGNSDPGRRRSAGWSILDTVPYTGTGAPGQFEAVACTDELQDEYLAIGLGFNGGAAGVINSELVGRALFLECDPNLADPDTPTKTGDQLRQPAPGGRKR